MDVCRGYDALRLRQRICLLLFIAQPILENEYGLHITISMLNQYDLTLLGIIVVSGFVVGLVPAVRAYRNSLADGMSIRI